MTPAPPSSSRERDAIDASARLPVLAFFFSSIFWLLIGSLLGLVSTWKMTCPALLDGQAWLTFGRVRPAHLNTIAYGWASLAGIGTGIWLMARLCRVRLQQPGLLFIAAVFWNLGLLAGSLGILGGESRSIAWLELPGYSSILIFAAFALIGIWVVVMFFGRKPGAVYVSQWYLLAAFLWFPWMYATANTLLVWQPVPGPAQPAINWWFAESLTSQWFVPLGLASAYYMIPKILGRPLYSNSLGLLGFWSLAVVSGWTGMQHLIGGPIPSWMGAVSSAAGLLTCVPVAAVAVNLHQTMRGHFDLLLRSSALRFTVFGAIAYTVTAMQGVLLAWPAFNSITHFTDFTVGHAHLGLYGFFSMVMFGAMYFIVPRLTGGEWPSAAMIRWHFRLSVAGIALLFGALSLGGLLQGLALDDPDASFKTSVEFATPFRWICGASGFLLLAANITFAALFLKMLFSPLRGQSGTTRPASAEETDPTNP